MDKDLRRTKVPLTPVSIQWVSEDIVDYKYLGVHTDNKLDWIKNPNALYRKGQGPLYFLRWLRSLTIWWTMLRKFSECVVASVILYAAAKDWTDWSARPVTLWGWSWTIWHWCQRGGCCQSYMSSWTMAPIHSMMWGSATGMHSVLDWFHQDARQSATGNHSCLWQSNCWTPRRECQTLWVNRKLWMFCFYQMCSNLNKQCAHVTHTFCSIIYYSVYMDIF